jgi:hypothetical protein
MLTLPGLLRTSRASACFTATSDECTVLLTRNVCYAGADGFGNDLFNVAGTPAEGTSFGPPNPNPNGCGWGGLDTASTNDPNVTVTVIVPFNDASYLQITAPSSYAQNGTSFKVFYIARSYNKSTGAGSKFLSGCLRIHPDVIKTNFPCSTSEALFNCGSCN